MNSVRCRSCTRLLRSKLLARADRTPIPLVIYRSHECRSHGLTCDGSQMKSTRYCYSFIPRRSRDQRASAVQARLEHADRMTAAFDPDLLTVDPIVDHANIRSLEFPVVWGAESFVSQVSSIVEDYKICNAGFAEVRLSVRTGRSRNRVMGWMKGCSSPSVANSTVRIQGSGLGSKCALLRFKGAYREENTTYYTLVERFQHVNCPRIRRCHRRESSAASVLMV
jgi:hypothetical protein